MTYYDLLEKFVNSDRCWWDYYKKNKCRKNISLSSFFCYPKNFIINLFKEGRKDSLVSGTDLNIDDFRAAHSVSAFLFGAVLAKEFFDGAFSAINLDYNKSSKYDPKRSFEFSYVWLLTSLYHDFGYSLEKNNVLAGKLYKCSLNKYEYIQGNKKLYLPNSTQEIVFPIRTAKTINRYFMYRLCKNQIAGKIDHGIAGGMYFFNNIIENYITSFGKRKEESSVELSNFDYKDKWFHVEQLPIFAYIADCIINHNIWKAGENTKEEYAKFELDSLIREKYEKVNFKKNPLLFVLAVADSLEPYKLFKSTGDRYNSKDALEIFENINVVVGCDNVTIKVSEEHSEKLGRTIKGMTEWIDIEYRRHNEEHIIIIK